MRDAWPGGVTDRTGLAVIATTTLTVVPAVDRVPSLVTGLRLSPARFMVAKRDGEVPDPTGNDDRLSAVRGGECAAANRAELGRPALRRPLPRIGPELAPRPTLCEVRVRRHADTRPRRQRQLGARDRQDRLARAEAAQVPPRPDGDRLRGKPVDVGPHDVRRARERAEKETATLVTSERCVAD